MPSTQLGNQSEGVLIEEYGRHCPNPFSNSRCNGWMLYSTKEAMEKAEANGSKCKSCANQLIKIAASEEELVLCCRNPNDNPNCKGRRRFCLLSSKLAAERAGWVCKSCGLYGKPKSEEHRIKSIKVIQTGIQAYIEKTGHHPMVGRTHTQEAKARMSRLGKSHTEESRIKISKAMIGEKNPFYGKTHSLENRIKMSKTVRAYYEDPSTHVPRGGSGFKGIGGWFNGLYFRSSCELAFLLDNQDVVWVTTERNEFAIPYNDENGDLRYYYPDYFGNNQLVEIKPLRWQSISCHKRNVELKRIAAEQYCSSRGWKYVFVEMKAIPKLEIFSMRRAGIVSLNSRWESKYQDWLVSFQTSGLTEEEDSNS